MADWLLAHYQGLISSPHTHPCTAITASHWPARLVSSMTKQFPLNHQRSNRNTTSKCEKLFRESLSSHHGGGLSASSSMWQVMPGPCSPHGGHRQPRLGGSHSILDGLLVHRQHFLPRRLWQHVQVSPQCVRPENARSYCSGQP